MKNTIKDGAFGAPIDLHNLFESMATVAREDPATGKVTERTKKISQRASERNSSEHIPDRFMEIPVPQIYLPIKDMVATLFDKELVMIRDLRPDLGAMGGLVMSDHPNNIFVIKGKSLPFLPVVGHELLHTVKIESPISYTMISKLVRTGIDGADVRDYSKSRDYMDVDGVTKKVYRWGRGKILEEMTADVVGDYFATPSFWKRVSKNWSGIESTNKGIAICSHMEKMAAELPDNPLNSNRFHQKSDVMERVIALNMGMDLFDKVDNVVSATVKDVSSEKETNKTTDRGPVFRGPR